LIIDDEPILRRALIRSLARRLDVTGVASCEEALDAIFDGARFDVILCDLQLEGMKGQQMCAELERQNLGQSERVIMHSGIPRDALDDVFVESVQWRYLEKPASLEDVCRIVDVVIRTHGRAT
jgi:CheY-like chemotaxis protein